MIRHYSRLLYAKDWKWAKRMKGIYDIHCHIVPGVDDGAKDLKTSVRMLQKEYDDGVRNIIATPHFRYDMFEPSLEQVKKQFLRVRKAAAEIGEDGIQMYLGCELHSSMDMTDCLKKGERLTMSGSRYVLTEFRTSDEKSYIRERVQALIRKGYYPIIAHVERYHLVVKNGLDFIDELRDMGAYIQMNADSIIGEDGFMIKRFCKKVIKEEMLDFVGSDGHDLARRTPHIGKCYDKIEKMMGTDYADMIFISNPECIIITRDFDFYIWDVVGNDVSV